MNDYSEEETTNKANEKKKKRKEGTHNKKDFEIAKSGFDPLTSGAVDFGKRPKIKRPKRRKMMSQGRKKARYKMTKLIQKKKQMTQNKRERERKEKGEYKKVEKDEKILATRPNDFEKAE